MDVEMADAYEAPRIRAKNAPSYDSFLSLPTIAELEEVETQEKFVPPHMRQKLQTFKNTSDRFQIKQRTFEHQYAQMYHHRLAKMKPWALAAAAKKWNSDNKVLKVNEKLLLLNNETGHCIIAGTLYKEMPLVPRVLDEFSKERSALLVPARNSFISKDDNLILEDDTGRTKLICDASLINGLVTGMVVAFKGTPQNGEFTVEDICVPGLPPQPAIPKLPSQNPKYVALISGVRVGDDNQNPLALQMFIDYVTGHLGSPEDEEFASDVVRVIFAGNSLCPPEKQPEGIQLVKTRAERIAARDQNKLNAPLREFDALMTQLSNNVNVDIMSGETDPANYTLPQQEMNKCMLPVSSRFTSLNTATNPYECEIDGKIFLGTSGQNVNNLERFMNVDNMLELAENTLHWRHLAPTAPDQLPCYPFYDYDPFIIERCPHVYFIGNQKELKTKLIHGKEGQVVRLVLIPSFLETQTVVLVNLNTLDVHPMSFSTKL